MGLEAEQEALHAELCDPEIFKAEPGKAPKIQARMAEVEQLLETAIERWAELEEMSACGGKDEG